MPAQIVSLDLASETGAIPQETYSDALIIGRSTNATQEPSPGYNRVTRYTSTTEVEQDYGSDSDIYTAASQIAARGTRHWHAIMLEATTHTNEVIGDSDTTSTNTGFVDNTPMAGDVDTVDVSVDGTTMTVNAVTDSPPATPSETDVANVNFDTGEVVTGTDSSGAGAGIEVTYDTLSWDAALPEIANSPADLLTLADIRADRSYVGGLDRLVTFAGENRMTVIAAYENGNRLTDDQAGVNLAHDIGGYIPSAEMFPISHKSDDDVAAEVTGQLATQEAWFNPYRDGDGYNLSTDFYRESLIGSPSDGGTFEGGDAENNQGPSNVIISDEGTLVLSNSLTTAGPSSNYRYLDVKRTENAVAAEVSRALRAMRLRVDRIPFDGDGRLLIHDALMSALQQFKGDGPIRDPVNEDGEELDMVIVPAWDDLSEDDRANRIWSGITIQYRLAGDVHTFSLTVNASV